MVNKEPLHHPLAGCYGNYAHTWQQWKEEWDHAQSYDHKHILIRRGFYMKASEDEFVERLLLYFRMAEGHLNGRGLEEKGDEWRNVLYPLESEPRKLRGYGTRRDMLRGLAHRAYLEIVYHFFASREDHFYYSDPYRYPWLGWVKRPEVMDAVLNFFRLEDGEIPNYDERTDSEKKSKRSLKDALTELCGSRWRLGLISIAHSWDGYPLAGNAERFLEVLFGLGRLDIFEKPMSDHSKCEHGLYQMDLVKLSDRDLTKLRELVLSERTVYAGRDEYMGSGVRRSIRYPPRTVHEALTSTTSAAARIYVHICTRQGVEWKP